MSASAVIDLAFHRQNKAEQLVAAQKWTAQFIDTFQTQGRNLADAAHLISIPYRSSDLELMQAINRFFLQRFSRQIRALYRGSPSRKEDSRLLGVWLASTRCGNIPHLLICRQPPPHSVSNPYRSVDVELMQAINRFFLQRLSRQIRALYRGSPSRKEDSRLLGDQAVSVMRDAYTARLIELADRFSRGGPA